MAELNEATVWEKALHGISVEEPLLGGQDGPLNRAIKQLGNRTLYLKEHVDEIEELIESGALDGGDPGTNDPATPNLIGIMVTSLPDKSAYETGEEFNVAGLVVQGVFSDSTRQVIYGEDPPGEGVNGYVLSAPDMASEGQKEITVTYQGFTAIFPIVVAAAPPPPVLTGIEITTLPAKLVYERHETLDLSGMVVNAVYSDGSKTALAYHSGGVSGYKCSSPDMSTPGSKTVTVSYKPEDTMFSQGLTISVVLGENYDGLVDNVTETHQNLLTVFGVSTPQQAWEMCHERINADGLCNYHGLGLGDYIDLTAGLPAPLNIAWNASYLNLRMYIVGFNIYKGVNGNTKNHIVWGWKNCPTVGSWRKIVDKTLYSDASDPGLFLQQFHLSLMSALQRDYFYEVTRTNFQYKNDRSYYRTYTITSSVWFPTAAEVAGTNPDLPVAIPLYANHAAIKNYDAVAVPWWLHDHNKYSDGTTFGRRDEFQGIVNPDGGVDVWAQVADKYNGDLSSGGEGIVPHFCEI